MGRALRAWRSHLRSIIRPASRSNQYAHVRLYSQLDPRSGPLFGASCLTEHAEVLERLNELQVPANQLYPRLGSNSGVLSCSAFNEKYAVLKNDEVRQGEEVVVRGKISKLTQSLRQTINASRKGPLFQNCWVEARVPRSDPRGTSRSRTLQLEQAVCSRTQL